MKLYLLVFASIFEVMNTDITMIEVYGKPNTVQNADVSANTDWKACMTLCYKSSTCILAWNNVTSCVRFNYTASGPVTQFSSEHIVAFKVNNPNGQCPSGNNPPTFNNKNATGSLYVTDLTADNKATWVNYEIYLVGKTWNFAFSYNKSCPDGFVSTLHSDTTISCFKQYKSTDESGFSYDHALALCRDISASLAGINYKEDWNYMTSKLQEVRKEVFNPNTYARIDGVRTPDCISYSNKTVCSTMNGFVWTDITLKNLNQYSWVTNISAQEAPSDNCIVLVAHKTQPIKADVRSCISDSPLQSYIVFCEKAAWTG